MLSIRPAVPQDVPLLLELIRELAEYERVPQAAVARAQDLLRDGRVALRQKPLASGFWPLTTKL